MDFNEVVMNVFTQETARRGEEQSRRLAALNTSQVFCSTEENSSDTSDIKASMDDGSLGSADDTDEIISPPPPKSLTTPSLPPSPMPPNREQVIVDLITSRYQKKTLNESSTFYPSSDFPFYHILPFCGALHIFLQLHLMYLQCHHLLVCMRNEDTIKTSSTQYLK